MRPKKVKFSLPHDKVTKIMTKRTKENSINRDLAVSIGNMGLRVNK